MKKTAIFLTMLANWGMIKPGAGFPAGDGLPVGRDTLHIQGNGVVSIRDFGAKCDGATDDYAADSAACAYCIAHPAICSTVSFPVGRSRITKPLMLQNNGRFFTIRLSGALPAKSAPDNYVSGLYCDFKEGPGIGIQLGRGIIIENLSIIGKYMFPYSVTNKNIASTTFEQWNDKSVVDSRYNPYAGIVIDPHRNASGSTGGTSGVEIRQCAIKQFMVGICLSPNGETLNDEMINMIDDDIEAVRVAIAIGQDQSKEIHIDRLKCWSSTHTILDGLHYGRGTGGGSVMIEGMNIAGNVNQLFNLNTDRFPLSAKDIYSESLFRIGAVGCGTGSNFINFQIDFLTGPGMPAADYLLSGCANFYGGTLRYYNDSKTQRLNFSNMTGWFRDLSMNNQPIIRSLYGDQQYWPLPYFDNVHNYYRGGLVTNEPDSLIRIRPASITVNRSNWTASITGVPGRVGDYILAAPTNVTGWHYDSAMNCARSPTLQIGRVIRVSGDTLYLDDVGLNVYQTSPYDAVYIDRIKKSKP
jgi:hypothetical protein